MKFTLFKYKDRGNIQKKGDRQWQRSAIRNALLTTISTCKDFNGSEIDAISVISLEFIKELAKQGREETITNLRLLGNWLRINKFKYSILAELLKDITWGINAGALTTEDSGEKEATSLICDYLLGHSDKELNIFDIGANKGEWSKSITNKVKFSQNISLHLFEPNLSLIKNLEKNINYELSQRLVNSIKAFYMPFGIGLKEESAFLYINGKNDEQATVNKAVSALYQDSYSNKAEINLIRGDEYAKRNNIKEIGLLKIDTEGTELDVLKSFMSSSIPLKIRFIQFEYGKANFYCNSGLKDFYEILKKDYIILRILPEGLLLESRYSEEIEDFNWANYLAVNKADKAFLNLFLKE